MKFEQCWDSDQNLWKIGAQFDETLHNLLPLVNFGRSWAKRLKHYVEVLNISGPNENSQKASISVYVLAANSQDEVLNISAPNENSQKASKSVNVLAAGSQDEICVNEHQN